MKKISLILFFVLGYSTMWADEGMWLPLLLKAKHKEMVKAGLKISPEMIYDVNNGSMKDAILQFGGGCTAEIISSDALVLTNHHCGYGSIAGVSTVENNYLKNGFWSKSKSEEIPIKGLTVKFLVEMKDVTGIVMNKTQKFPKELGDKKLEEELAKIVKSLNEEYSENGKYIVDVKPLYNGNQYFMWKYIIYKDIRLVATPPENLGKFGGDTDNWMWPRHTADFSMFRIYANKNNEPAEYSSDNVPFKPKHFLPVNTKGIKEGDFAMIMGYPGRTNRFETASGVKSAIDYSNPTIVKLREKRLAIMKNEMLKDPAVRLAQASKYAQIANYWKYFIGQTEQLERHQVIQKKLEEEKKFLRWAKSKKENSYLDIFQKIEQVDVKYRKVVITYYYFNEGIFTPSSVVAAYSIQKSMDAFKGNDKVQTKEQAMKTVIAGLESFFQGYNETIDRNLFASVNYMFSQEIDKQFHPTSLTKLILDYGSSESSFAKAANDIYSKSIFTSLEKVKSAIESGNWALIEKDPLYQYAVGLQAVYETKIKKPVMDCRVEDEFYTKTYLEGLLKMNNSKDMYPDANSTMRVTYGNVKAYSPKDAISYHYFTTADGLVDKYKPNDYEFDLPVEIVEMVKNKNFGGYANSHGELPVCFITTNDITGGNSGSPVIDGNGNLIGLAFDGNWEAMSGDIYFDKNYKRTICVDVRYILWLIEKYGKAPNLISEMDIIKK